MTNRWTTAFSLVLSGALAACKTTQIPPPAVAPIVVTAAPAPAVVTHVEAHLAGGHITLEHQILFDTDAAHIQEQQSQATLADLVAVLRENSQIRRLRIEGHTDTRGDAAHNQDLSNRRAQAVADYLRGHGFESIQFEPTGAGATRPLCTENTTDCNDRNRRVEFTITDPAPTP